MALPELVETYLTRCVPTAAAEARRVRIDQSGEMLKRHHAIRQPSRARTAA